MVMLQSHQLAFKHYIRGNFSEAENILMSHFLNNKFNIYIASLMSDIMWASGKKMKLTKYSKIF